MSEIFTFLIKAAVLAFVAVSILLGVHVLSRSDTPVRKALGSLISLLLIPFHEVADAARKASAWLWEQAADVFGRAVLPDDSRWAGWPVVGAFFNAGIVIVNLYAEWWLLLATLPLLGFAVADIALPQEAASLTTLAILSLSLFWGGMLAEALGATCMTPWGNRSRRDRLVLGLVSVGVLASVLWASWQIGRIRGFEAGVQFDAVVDLTALNPFADPAPDNLVGDAAQGGAALAEPDPFNEEYDRLSRVLPVYINALLVLLGALTFVAGKWALSHALAYTFGLLLYVLWLAAWLLQFVSGIVERLLETLRDDLVPDFTKLAYLGMSGFVDTLREVREDLFRRQSTAAAAAGAESIYEFSHDVREAAAPDGYRTGDGAGRKARRRPASHKEKETTDDDQGRD